jgi:LacI family transcriptional regulator
LTNKKVTITDIANTLDISIVSVSRALTGQPGISSELKQKIIDRAQAMGYIKNKKSATVNILVLHQKPYQLDNSNSSLILQGVEKALQTANLDYQMEFVAKPAQEKLALPYKLAKGAQFDGVIYVSRFALEYYRYIHQFIKNQVLLTGYSPAYDADIVRFNFNHAGYQQCRYLIQKGHTQIGFCGKQGLFRNQERLLGIQTALNDSHIAINRALFIDWDEDYPAKLSELIIAQKLPTAFICDFDFTAIELIKLLHKHNIAVPEDISIIGWGNTEIANLTIPALTTWDLNIEYAGEVTVDTLLQRINQPDQPYRTIGILSRLVERDSVKPRQ